MGNPGPSDTTALFDAKAMLVDRPVEAEIALRSFLVGNLGHPIALRYLADAVTAQGKTVEAAMVAEQVVASYAREPLVADAIRNFTNGAMGVAERLVRQALSSDPENVAALLILAEIAIASGVDAEAESILRQALKLVPGHVETQIRLADTLFRQNDVLPAISVLDDVLTVHPSNMAAALSRLTMLGQIGEYDQALDGYADLLDRLPNDARAYVGHANLLKTVGRMAESATAFRRSLAIAPGTGDAWWGLADLKSGALGHDDRSAMQAVLRRPALSREQATKIQFALGKANEDASQYTDSFEYYRLANYNARSVRVHDAAAVTDEISRSAALYTSDFFTERAGSGNITRSPIFILGMPRAGSTLIEQILASHSAVEGTAELPYIGLLVQQMLAARWRDRSTRFPEIIADIKPEQYSAIGESYLRMAAVHRRTDRPYFIDKLPENWSHVGLIHLIMPNAIIIDARRAPMACCFSNYKQYYARGRDFSYNQSDLGRYYKDYVQLMDHFENVLPGRILRVDHEHLTADPEVQIRRLLAHCDLAFEDACLRFHENTRPVRTASAAQVRRPIDQSSGHLWLHYRPWLGELERALGDLIE
jgi:tetratricopeptide (TPR) repeat protein